MHTQPVAHTAIATLLLAAAFTLSACEKKTPDVKPPVTTDPAKAPGATKATDDHGHTHAPGDDHDHDHADGHDHGPMTDLGSLTLGTFVIKASRSAAFEPGKDVSIDATVTPKPAAVRFWIGTQDAKGSVKAKADAEGADGWHTHVEIPNPFPADSKLWIEVEDAKGAKAEGALDLKR